MSRAEILFNYIDTLKEKRSELLKEIQEYLKDMEEVAELQTILREYLLKSYFQPDNSKSCYINYCLSNDGEHKFRMFLPNSPILLFSINTKGKYIFCRKSNGNLMHPLIETEIEYLSAFCEYFPKYRDNVFKYVESFQNK